MRKEYPHCQQLPPYSPIIFLSVERDIVTRMDKKRFPGVRWTKSKASGLPIWTVLNWNRSVVSVNPHMVSLPITENYHRDARDKNKINFIAASLHIKHTLLISARRPWIGSLLPQLTLTLRKPFFQSIHSFNVTFFVSGRTTQKQRTWKRSK